MKKFLIGLLIVILAAAGTAAGLGYVYTQSEDYTSEEFGEHYTINGEDCSGLTYADVNKLLTNKWNHQEFTVVNESGEELAHYTSLGCVYNLPDQLASLKQDNFIMAALNHYLDTKVEVDLKTTVKSTSNEFKEKVESADFLQPGEDTIISQDAYVDTSDPDFPIIEEVYGTDIDKDKVFDAIIKQISSGSWSLTFNENDYYAAPEVLSDDETLAAYQSFCREYLTQKITYDMGDSTFTIGTEQLAKFYKTDASGELNKKGIKSFVKSMKKKYDNVGIKRTIKTFAGKKVKISGGTYGWTIDKDEEIKQLTADLKAREDVKREPVYSTTGYTKYSNGIGKTYVDVDLKEQTVTLYIKGKDKFHCEVVTGDKSKGKSTPEGTYYIRNKLRDVTMRGTNADGTKYEVPAKYWMGVTTNGIGLHDSNWRTEFGGDIWKTNGSHGCINMPKDKIKKMYDQVKVGMPVIMHY